MRIYYQRAGLSIVGQVYVSKKPAIVEGIFHQTGDPFRAAMVLGNDIVDRLVGVKTKGKHAYYLFFVFGLGLKHDEANLKQGGKTHEKFFDLLGGGLGINGFHLYHILFRVVIGGIEVVGHMELMTMCILMHIIVLA